MPSLRYSSSKLAMEASSKRIFILSVLPLTPCEKKIINHKVEFSYKNVFSVCCLLLLFYM